MKRIIILGFVFSVLFLVSFNAAYAQRYAGRAYYKEYFSYPRRPPLNRLYRNPLPYGPPPCSGYFVYRVEVREIRVYESRLSGDTYSRETNRNSSYRPIRDAFGNSNDYNRVLPNRNSFRGGNDYQIEKSQEETDRRLSALEEQVRKNTQNIKTLQKIEEGLAKLMKQIIELKKEIEK